MAAGLLVCMVGRGIEEAMMIDCQVCIAGTALVVVVLTAIVYLIGWMMTGG